MNNKFERLYLLDFARAIAATCVVLLHYQHFYSSDYNQQLNFVKNLQPFYNILEIFYEFGTVAVQFFFILSGFIFFMFYRERILEGVINFKNFIILRLTRLYPLHLLTLILVLIIQFFYNQSYSEYFIYKNNNLENFIAHFLLIQEWGLIGETASYNGPSWSISVEFFLYIIFFLISIFFIKNIFQSLITIIFSLLIYFFLQPVLNNLILGLLLFYIGGFTFFFYTYLKKFYKKKFFILILIIIDIMVFGRFLNEFFLNFQNSIEFLIGNKLFILLFFIKFPLLIINLSILQLYKNNLGKNIKLLGDISYTIYLVHFPIQLLFAFVIKKMLIIDFNSPFFFLIYVSTVFLVSILIYKFFELPLKDYLRGKLIEKKN